MIRFHDRSVCGERAIYIRDGLVHHVLRFVQSYMYIYGPTYPVSSIMCAI